VTEIEELARMAVDCGYYLHKEIGPGLLESVYEALLFEMLTERGLSVARQIVVPIRYKDVVIDHAFKADIIIQNTLIVELKSTERFAPVHGKQLLTYLRLMNLPLGLLMNFGMYSFKDGIKRIANNYYRNMQS
jgi:GxxExxY protein